MYLGRRETPNLAYPPSFKLEVALHAQKYSQYAAAKIFSVARRRIFDWMRQISKLQELIAKGHMKKMTGRGPKNRDIDQALFDWYSERRSAGERPRSCEVSIYRVFHYKGWDSGNHEKSSKMAQISYLFLSHLL